MYTSAQSLTTDVVQIFKRVSHAFLMVLLLVTFTNVASAQLSITDESEITIDFDDFDGSGFAPEPSAGQLDTDTWEIIGIDEGNILFGGSGSTGGHAQGTSTGGVGGLGIYAFDVTGSGDYTLGVQPGTDDFTDGSFTLKIQNNTGNEITGLVVKYEIWVYNDQDRSNSFNFSYSEDNSSYTSVSSLDFNTTGTADASASWTSTNKTAEISGLALSDGFNFYVKWSSNDVSGSGSRDEIALNNILIKAVDGEQIAKVSEGDLVISEIMANPSTSTDADGEYFELYNRTNQEIDIEGFIISEDGTSSDHVIDGANGTTIVPAYGFLSLGRSSTTSENGNYTPDYEYGTDIGLTNSGQSLWLINFQQTITTANYSGSGGNGIAEELADISSGHDGVTESGDYQDVSGDSYGDGDSGSPGSQGSNLTLTYGARILGDAGWRLLSAPVDNMAISQITDDTPIQGYGDGFDKNFYTGYDGSAYTSPGDLSGNITNGNAFFLYFFDNTSAGSSELPITLDATGSEPSTDVSITPTSNDGSNDGWTLLGNPFQSSIDLNLLTDDGTFSSAGYVWDDSDNSYVSTTTTDNKLTAWQGGFFENNNATQVTIPTSAKTTGGEFYKRPVQNKRFINLKLTGMDEHTGIKTTDKSTVLYFHEDASHEHDSWDLGTLAPMTSPYAIMGVQHRVGGEVKLRSQDSRPYNPNQEIQYDLEINTTGVKGAYTLQIADELNIPDDWTIQLKDLEANETVDLRETGNYTFYLDDSKSQKSRVDSDLFAPKVASVESSNSNQFMLTVKPGGTINSVEEESNLPKNIQLQQNYPNPFNPSTSIEFALPEKANVQISVYNAIGQHVATLLNEVKAAGSHEVIWDASSAPSGIYFYRLSIGNRSLIKKMTLIK